ncbi:MULTISPECIES: hypothetical protein [unclassified Sphingomonas]|uniref:hypothetical protein n=1 Tax=unclassified Sphingomonas TaxID=196159 RepID=UPI000700EB29|nr:MULTISPECIES: hypothetical protein [unclassified Sphingomonas]KQM61325.1 hypothetical protein ASE65_07215 [Sphingomonas sp. Leaf16]KQN12420.1 hypothetical protein ASE81_08225 [Sphingomonas sp. Leaf29]KQN18901.1 hypothetical protein ASE83_08150 [Sphingomonas sp. Leaf32]
MRLYATIATTMLLAGCGFGPATGGPELLVTGPSEAVATFVRQQGAQIPSRATTFPQSIGNGRSSARVLMPVDAGARTVRAVMRQASVAGLTTAIVADH